MNGYLVSGEIILLTIGAGHSYLGERFIFKPLFAGPDLPGLLGSRSFMKNTLRFAWHITTALLFGLAVLLGLAARAADVGPLRPSLLCVAGALLACAILAGVLSRLKHFAWALFLAAAVLVALGAR